MLQALRNEVIVKPVFEEHKGLIEIPKSALEYKQYYGEVFGEVVSIGEDYPYGKLKIGDKIIFQRHEGKRIEVDGEKYLVLKEKWVMARVIE
jgi:co-chaperonin GroES (HSP10)